MHYSNLDLVVSDHAEEDGAVPVSQDAMPCDVVSWLQQLNIVDAFLGALGIADYYLHSIAARSFIALAVCVSARHHSLTLHF